MEHYETYEILIQTLDSDPCVRLDDLMQSRNKTRRARGLLYHKGSFAEHE